MSFRLTVEYEPDKSKDEVKASFLTLEISRMNRVSEISLTVYKHIESNLRLPADEYSLYWPENKVWLVGDRPIGQILRGVRSAHLLYRPRKRPFKIRFLDASSKVIILDETLSVKSLVSTLCRQLTLKHPEEMSLVVAVDFAVTNDHPAANQETSLSKSPSFSGRRELAPDSSAVAGLSPRARRKQFIRPGSPKSVRPGSGERPGSAGKFRKKSQIVTTSTTKKKQLSHKHQIRIDTPWLDPQKTLTEQEVTCNDDLILMYRFYYHTHLERESKECELLYKQARAMFLAGEMLSNPEHIPKFTALLCQITKGDFVSKEETHELLLKLKRLLAPPKYKAKSMSKEVANHHKHLRGLSVQDAKCWFVKLWSTCHLFGMEFFSCVNCDLKEKGLVGISRDKILFLHLNNKKKNKEWEATSLSHWEQDESNETMTLYFRDSSNDKLKIQIPDYSSVLIDCLTGHRELATSFPSGPSTTCRYHFDEDEMMLMEFQKYFNLTEVKGGGASSRTHKRAGSLTVDEICLSDKISPESPMVSTNGEQASKKELSWENPAFDNLDQLMEERFSFLDFNEDVDEQPPPDTLNPGDTPPFKRPTLSPQHYPSPLLTSHATTKRTERDDGDSSTSSSNEDIFVES